MKGDTEVQFSAQIVSLTNHTALKSDPVHTKVHLFLLEVLENLHKIFLQCSAV